MRRRWYMAFGLVLLILLILLAAFGHVGIFESLCAALLLIFVHDIFQKKRAILRNFPILGHLRFILEFLRPEIQQYFIADDRSERPFDRTTRNVIYERAKGLPDVVPFGTQRDLYADGAEWVLHSLAPKTIAQVESSIMIGGERCKKPYNASRLNISAMSHGALSPNAIMAMNRGAQLGHFAQNTGEGGLSQYHLSGGDLIWQIGTGYFGCRDDHGNFDPVEFSKEANRPEVKMIEVKLSQGAKPSHGGILPAAKLTREIAAIRKVPMGQDVISPPQHTAFSNPIGLLEFLDRLRTMTEGKPVGFKLCIGRRSEFLSICKAMLQTGLLPDFITVDGAEGGTGAAPLEYVDHMGTPLDEALIFVHNSLIGIGLRDKIRIIASGKVATGFDMVKRIAMGADLCNSARAMMMATGCIQSLQCHANTCPTGVATQNPRLMKGLVVEDKMHRVARYHASTVHSLREIVASMGLSNPSELKPWMIRRRINHETIKSLDQIYPLLSPGDLLSGANLSEEFRRGWGEASAEKF